MQELEKYNPFNLHEYLIISKNDKKFLVFKNHLLELNDKGYIPKSGLLFDEVLSNEICFNKEILDLGCGYLGIIGIIASLNGAKHIDSIDNDDDCIKWFNKIIKENGYKNFNCFKSNYYEKIEKSYDLILTNPPQLPMKKGSLHDSGGVDGRKYILEIMEQSLLHLKEGGSLYILVFDFLGSTQRTNGTPSLKEIAYKIGYKTIEIVYEFEKEIKKNSLTYNQLPYINEIYPLYNFNKKKHKIQIIRMEK